MRHAKPQAIVVSFGHQIPHDRRPSLPETVPRHSHRGLQFRHCFTSAPAKGVQADFDVKRRTRRPVSSRLPSGFFSQKAHKGTVGTSNANKWRCGLLAACAAKASTFLNKARPNFHSPARAVKVRKRLVRSQDSGCWRGGDRPASLSWPSASVRRPIIS